MRRIAMLLVFASAGCAAGSGGDETSAPRDVPGDLAAEGALAGDDDGDAPGTPDVPATPVGPVASVSARDGHTCAIDTAGVPWCFGAGSRSQLGDGGITSRPTPSPAVLFEGKAAAIAPGGSHTCALREDGAVLCWGDGTRGQVGIGAAAAGTVAAPAEVTALGTGGVRAVASGLDHACAVKADGTLWCWGANDAGALGDGSYTDRSEPVQVLASVSSVSAGFRHTCAVTVGAAQCWGANDHGELGDGTTIGRAAPGAVGKLSGEVVAAGAGGAHTCVIRSGGALACWGSNDHGQLGTGERSDSPNPDPKAVPGMDAGVESVAAGGAHTCAIKTGALWCWGSGLLGQVGDGTQADRFSPAQVTGVPGPVTAVAAGRDHTCAIGAGGRLWCWGDGGRGQLGRGSTAGSGLPVQVP